MAVVPTYCLRQPKINALRAFRGRVAEVGLTSARNYVVLRAELDSPDKTTLVYRDFVRNAVRRNVLEWHGFRRDRTLAMVAEAGIPDADREQVANYIDNEIRGLHEGNAIWYRLTVEDLALIGPPSADNAT